MPTLKCIDTGNRGAAKTSSTKKGISTRQSGIKPTRKRSSKTNDGDGDDKLNPDAVGGVAVLDRDGGTVKKSKSIPQAADESAAKVANQQEEYDSKADTILSVSIQQESESLQTKIVVNPDEINNKARKPNNKDFILSGADSDGNIISTTLKFAPTDKSEFLAALNKKGIQYKPKHWKGPRHEYSLERGSDTTAKRDEGTSNAITTLANLYLNDDFQEMWELSFNPKTMTYAAATPTIGIRGVLSTQHHAVFVNDNKLSDGDAVSLKDSDILHFFNHNINPQFAFAFIVRLSVTIESA